MNEIILEMKHISKSFPGVKALEKVDFSVKKGKVHALMGENGAGKSTLMKCLFGIYKKDEGQILLDNQEVQIKDTKDALRYGISMVHQELQLIHERSIAENIFCGRYPVRNMGFFHVIDHLKMKEKTKEILNEIQVSFDPDIKISSLSVSQRQSVEIAKAISNQSRIIIMDEPTSSLTENEVQHLFEIIEQLKKKGTAIIYISHKMEEILKIADEVTIMRDGQVVGTWPSNELTTDLMIQKMVGRTLTNRYPDLNHQPKEVILCVENLSSVDRSSYQNISFELRKGEILGIGGLVGAKRSEMVEGLFGIQKNKSQKILYKGKEVMINKPHDAIEKGIALLTEDRRASGIFGVLNVLDNVGIASLDKYMKYIFLNQRKMDRTVKEMVQKMNIKTPDMKTLIQSLSGGNQQKVIIARWLANDPEVLILDEPTRGIDVGAKYEIYTIMAELVKTGKSIIMISSEMSELIGMSDRIMVMCEGKVKGFVDSQTTTQEEIMKLSTIGME